MLSKVVVRSKNSKDREYPWDQHHTGRKNSVSRNKQQEYVLWMAHPQRAE